MVGTNHENLTHEIFLTMNNYHGQHIVTRARACLIFVDGPDNENLTHENFLTRTFPDIRYIVLYYVVQWNLA